MPFNGSGVFQRLRSWVADAAAGIKIRADYHDAEDDGFAEGLTNCITKDGQTLVTQNIPWNSKRITGLADPVNPQDAVTLAALTAKFANGGTLTGDWTVTGALTVTGLFTANGGAVINGPLTVNGNETINGSSHITGALTVDGELTASLGYLRFNTPGGPNYIQANGGGSYSLGGGGTIWHSGNFTPGSYQPLLGFTPVQQSGGAYQLTNKVYIGWDGSKLRAQVDSTDLGQFAMGNALTNTRLAYAGDVSTVSGSTSALYEPYAGAVMTGWEWTNVGYPVITYMRFRYLQIITNGGWFTVGYV